MSERMVGGPDYTDEEMVGCWNKRGKEMLADRVVQQAKQEQEVIYLLREIRDLLKAHSIVLVATSSGRDGVDLRKLLE